MDKDKLYQKFIKETNQDIEEYHDNKYMDWLESQILKNKLSIPNEALKDSHLQDMILGYKMICKPEINFEKYYSKGFAECYDYIKYYLKCSE